MYTYKTSSPTDTKPILTTPLPVDRSTRAAIANMRRNKYAMLPSVSPKLSATSDPKLCFVYRRNSKRFQEFMFNYAYTLVKSNVLSAEV